jgi:hypothetical protein
LRSQGVTYSLDKRPAGDTFDPLTATGTDYGYFLDGNATISSINYQYYTTARSCVAHDLNNYEFYYLEFTVFNPNPGGWLTTLGLGTKMLNYQDGGWPGHLADGVGVGDDGTIWSNNLQLTPTLGTFPTGVFTFGMAVGGGKVWFRINGGNWNGDPAARPGSSVDTTGPVVGVGGITVPAGAQHFMAAVSANNKDAFPVGHSNVAWVTVNTAGPFAYTPPDGFIPWLVLPDTAFYAFSTLLQLEPALLTAPSTAVPGWELVRKGDVDNVKYFDVEVPKGYSSFQLRVVGASFNGLPDQLALKVSTDNGLSYLSDAANMDTYAVADEVMYTTLGTTIATSSTPAPNNWFADVSEPWDMVGYISPQVQNFDYYLDFSPGSTTQYFKGVIHLSAEKLYSAGYGTAWGTITISSNAALQPTKKRVNYIRLGGYWSLTNPTGADPTPGHAPRNVATGQWYLLGLKA